jgi:hypothetical protein
MSGCGEFPAQSKIDSAPAETDILHPDQLHMVGEYLCTVSEKASIARQHLEDAAPPAAVSQNGISTKFRIGISEQENEGETGLQLVELPYGGPDRDPYEWHTQDSVIHNPYVGDGRRFLSSDKEAEGFFVLGPTMQSNADGDLEFYQSGFEWAGGEDTLLSVRWGRCKRA